MLGKSTPISLKPSYSYAKCRAPPVIRSSLEIKYQSDSIGALGFQCLSHSVMHDTFIFNPYAKIFIPLKVHENKFTPLNPNVDSFTPSLRYNVEEGSIPLNPHARSFIPLHLRITENNVIAIMIVIALLIFVLFLINIICDRNDDDLGPKSIFKKMKQNNPKKIVIGHVNINSIRQKFVFLKEIVQRNIDILLISETKLDQTFPVGQFYIDGFHSPFRKDRDGIGAGAGGGLLLFILDHIPCQEIKWNFSPKIEAIAVEINLKKRKWLITGSYIQF